MRDRPGIANRAMPVLSTMMRMAEIRATPRPQHQSLSRQLQEPWKESRWVPRRAAALRGKGAFLFPRHAE
ncbi:MAG: hypothetical protein OXD42_02005 [Rhodospirillaceae bacterium]|nr:hypothetical protein [Rhodospirillaceae bacterium]MCY4238450.1 hypothetical protein [Rhodospirillaceae bacterium]